MRGKPQTVYSCAQSGFTLVELLIAMVVALLVSAAVYASYKVQQQTHKAQMQVTVIQQNLRAAMDTMTRDFMSVGFDPYQEGGYEILGGTTAKKFLFTADLCEDGGAAKAPGAGDCPDGPFSAGQPMGPQDMTETYEYRLFDSNGDGEDDALMRELLVPGAPIAENIEFVEFYYILANGSATLTPTATSRPCIRSVRVTLIGRADEPDFKYTNNETYTRGSGAIYGPFNDNFRRRAMIKTIDLRNMGITFSGSTCS